MTSLRPERGEHAALIVCPREEDLKLYALRLLTRLYCPKECGVCPQCRRAAEGTHPDVLFIRTDDASIKVDTVRQITPFIAEKAYEGGIKAVVVERAELMTTEAQNCLLKPLEEPPAGTAFILQARSENAILPTIASRCRRIRLKPLPLDEAARCVIEQTGADTDEARLFAALSGGYTGAALALQADASFRELRQKTIDMCGRLAAAKNMAVQKHADFLEENREQFGRVLHIMQSVFFDMQWAKLTGTEAGMTNIDRAGEITKFAFNFTRGALSTIIDLLCETERGLRFALNFRLMTESMLLNILEVKNRW